MCGEALEELTLPKHLEKVGAYAFYNCSFKRISFPASTVRRLGRSIYSDTLNDWISVSFQRKKSV